MAALKYMLQGLVVHDATDGCPSVGGVKQHAYATGRQVKVKYRSPEDEVSKYQPPCIIMEFPDISMANERMHQGARTQLPYAPEGYPQWWPAGQDWFDPNDSPYFVSDYPVPYNIDYQITVYTRIKRDHLMPILAALESWDKLGRMATLKIPQDGTFRRITRMSGPHISWVPSDDQEKKLFTATYLVRVPTELFGNVFTVAAVNEIIVNGNYGISPTFNPSDYYNEEGLSSTEIQESFGLLSVGNQSNWNTAQLNQ
jgi:hypothetical protein